MALRVRLGIVVLGLCLGTGAVTSSDARVALAQGKAERGAKPGKKAADKAEKAVADEGAEKPAKPVRFDRQWLEPYFTGGEGAAALERFRREDNKGAAERFTKLARRAPARSPERLAAQYMAATAHMELEDWTAAGALFEELAARYTALAPYPAYYAARCRLRRGDAEGALGWAEKVPDDAVLKAEAVLIELDALASLGRFADVERKGGEFLDRFPNGPRRAEAMYQRAQAMESLDRPPAEIAALYRRIWTEAPLEAWSRRAEERLQALASRQTAARPGGGGKAAGDPPSADDLKRITAGDWLTRGLILFDRNQNEEAEAAMAAALSTASSTMPAGPATAELRCKAEFHRAQSVFKQRNRTRAAPLFTLAQAACKEASDKDLYIKSLYQGARCLANMGNREAARALYAQVEKEAPEHSYADDARLRAAETYTDEDKPAPAAALLAELADRYPNGDQVSESLWRLSLAAIREQRWPEAHRWLDENLRRVPREDVWYAEGRALYWKARVLGAQGDKKGAVAFYTRSIREYPLSVYAFLALERLRVEAPEARKALVHKLRADLGPAGARSDAPGTWQFSPRPVFGTAQWRRAVELARLGFGSDARRELARLGFSAPESRDAARKRGEDGQLEGEREDVYWITALLLDRGRSWAAAHAIPRYTLTAFRADYPAAGKLAARWRLAYPRAFPEVVAPNCKANRVPEWLQLAIMREESAFNPRIESFANALGLTQMLVKTARRFTERTVTRESLLDPARNLEVGSRLLSFLLDRYGGAAPLAIASYNAGEGAVDRWLADPERADMPLDEFLETIPYDETRNYTKRVLSSYITYAWLYDGKQPVPELRFSLKPPRPERVGRPAGRTPKSRRIR
jgi:soluble lytic murein transglycosylase